MRDANDRPAITLRDVTVTAAHLRAQRLGSSNDATPDRSILDNVCLSLQPGEVFSLLGESGGGKSTLLRLINGLVTPDSGEVVVAGQSVSVWDIQDLRRTAIYVPQRPPLFGGTIADELRLALIWAGRAASDERSSSVLETVGLAKVELRLAAEELSEGQRTRLSLARALLLEPRILMLDEPTGALDVATAQAVLTGTKAWAAEHAATLMVVSHRPEDLATLGGRAAVLVDGSLAGPFAASELLAGDGLPAEVTRLIGTITNAASRAEVETT